jgi:hypothetical protein
MTLTLRLGLSMLALIELVLGIWTLGFPESFYRNVPTVDLTPPYSEHLFRDFGGATLGLGIVLAAAAIWPETRLVIVALVAFLAFSAPHLAFHLGHLHGATRVEAVLLTSGLTALVVVPVALIVVAGARARRARSAGIATPAARS